MSSGMFRCKESSNRIELSRLVQDLLNLVFWAPCGSGEGASGWGASGGMGGVPPHTCMQMHVHTHAQLYMYRNCKWPPTWRHPCLACLACLTCMCMHACAYVCMHACMGHPPTHLYPPQSPSTHPPPPRGVDPRNHLKFDNTSTYQDISIPFEDLKSVKNSPPMGGSVVWWVGGWLGGLMGGVRSNH